MELSSTLYYVVSPLCVESLAVGEGQQTLSIFFVLFEGALEYSPFFAYLVEISEIIASINGFWLVVVEDSSAVEATQFPLSSVIWFSGRVVEGANTIHLVVDPISLIVDTIGICENSFAVFFAVDELTLVPIPLLLDNMKLLFRLDLRYSFSGLLRVNFILLLFYGGNDVVDMTSVIFR